MVDVRRADLHAHSIYSDGSLAPAALVRLICESGISGLALTDHDTIGGLPEAVEEGNRLGIEIISGVELSAILGEERIHLLAYGFDAQDTALNAHFELCRLRRYERARQIIKRLTTLQLLVDADTVLRQHAPGRLHIAEALVRSGHVSTVREAFDRLLGHDQPAYVAAPAISAPEAIALVHAAGGYCVLAHPGHHTSQDLLKSLAGAGLDGLETIHPSHDDSLTAYYRQIAREMNLLETAGSDFHNLEHAARLGRYAAPWPWLTRLQVVRTLRVQQ